MYAATLVNQLIFQPIVFQERRDGVTESCLYVNHVTSDSFRQYTIIAENAVAIGRQRTILTERTSSAELFHYSPNKDNGSYSQQPKQNDPTSVVKRL